MAFGSDITQEIGNVGGRTTAQGYNSADDVRKQYTGYERDDESGLDFAQARYYNSNHGRFTSIDPLSASGKLMTLQVFSYFQSVLSFAELLSGLFAGRKARRWKATGAFFLL
jgi:RHS repeat-associated protein